MNDATQMGRYRVRVSNPAGEVVSARALVHLVPLVGWGDSKEGQLAVPPGLTHVVAVALGRAHALALTAEGRVIAWGNNLYGQTNVPPDLTHVVAIAAGAGHNLALTSEGRVVAWGFNHQGQARVPEGLDKVAAAENYNLVLTGFPPGQAPPQILAPHWVVGTEGLPLRVPLAVANGADQLEAVGLPAGLVLEPARRVITGVPAERGFYEVTLRASNARGTQQRTLHFQITPAGIPAAVAWGDTSVGGWGERPRYDYGQSRPLGLSDVVAVVAGSGAYGLALTGEGRVMSWGYNRDGRATIPAGLSKEQRGGHSRRRLLQPGDHGPG